MAQQTSNHKPKILIFAPDYDYRVKVNSRFSVYGAVNELVDRDLQHKTQQSGIVTGKLKQTSASKSVEQDLVQRFTAPNDDAGAGFHWYLEYAPDHTKGFSLGTATIEVKCGDSSLHIVAIELV